jgi:hypothetical protein
MSYTINLTSGAKLTDVIDGSVDQSATDLTLIGRNITNYGTFLNDNFVYLLENFANVTEPPRPISGQLWYDTSTNILKIYNGQGFVPTGNTQVSSSQPTNLSAGTLWIDSGNKQLKFYDGVDFVTAGPIYTSSQGTSGFVVTDVLDTFQQNHTIVELRVANVLIGIYSKDLFTPMNPIAGFSGEVQPGFNVASDTSLSFNMTVSQALGLLDSNGDLQTTDSFMSKLDDTFARGTVSLLNDIPVKLGAGQEMQVNVDTTLTQLRSNKVGQNFQVTSRRTNIDYDPSIFVSAIDSFVGIYTDIPTATLDVNGDVRIRGDLVVEGATTTINTTNLSVEDLLIEIGKVDTPTDTTANNGGILLAGSTPKTITWKLANNAWVSSENFDLQGGNSYRIGGNVVLTNTALGTSVATAAGLTSIGHLTSLNVSWLSITGSTITYVNSSATYGKITLVPNGAVTVDVSSKKITNLATPIDPADGANKLYVDETAAAVPLGIAIDIGSTTITDNTAIITNYLNKIFPPAERTIGTILRAYCTNNAPASAFKQFTQTAGAWVYNFDY